MSRSSQEYGETLVSELEESEPIPQVVVSVPILLRRSVPCVPPNAVPAYQVSHRAIAPVEW